MPPSSNWDPHYRSPLSQRELRVATHASILGPDPRCGRCGETRRVALQRRGREVICYECQSEEQGRSRIEQDHPLGRGERWRHYTRPLAGNTHRVISSPDTNARDAWPVSATDSGPQSSVEAAFNLSSVAPVYEVPLRWQLIDRPPDIPVDPDPETP